MRSYANGSCITVINMVSVVLRGYLPDGAVLLVPEGPVSEGLVSGASKAGRQSASGTFGSRVTAFVELAAAGTSCKIVRWIADQHVYMPGVAHGIVIG